jgi:hypothetical protein
LVICALLAFCLGTGFFVSWDALQVAATAAHASPAATRAYAFCVDGVIAIALAASVVLRHTPGARRYSLRILAVFSVSSVVLNIAHGLGAFEGPVAWPLLALTAANAPAAIGFGSHLFVKTLQVLFPSMDGTVVHEVAPVLDAAPVPAEKPKAQPPTVPAKAVVKPSPKKTPAPDETVNDVELQGARHADRAYRATNNNKPITRDALKTALAPCGTAKATALLAALKREREVA